MQAAVRDNFIVNYSRLVIWFYEPMVLRLSLLANGLEPSLVGPFSNTAFWIKTNKSDIRAIRAFNALKKLAELDLGFIDSGTSCSLNGESDQGPKLLSLEKMSNYARASQGQGCMSIYTSMPSQLEAPLFEAMIKAGFYFDYDSKEWRHDSPGSLAK